MFEGSMHVPEGSFDNWLEAAGGNNNGSTNNDRTNYSKTCQQRPELALFLSRIAGFSSTQGARQVNGSATS
jgi:zinc protease